MDVQFEFHLTETRPIAVRQDLRVQAFVALPKNYRMAGTVQIGQEFGILALSPEGGYVRVNGTRIQPLPNFVVRHAMALESVMSQGDASSLTPFS